MRIERRIGHDIKAVVWGENIHEQTNEVVRNIYPNGMHNTIAAALNTDPSIEATTATLQEPEHGLSVERLAKTDVLLWWGHKDPRRGIGRHRRAGRQARLGRHGADRSAFGPFLPSRSNG